MDLPLPMASPIATDLTTRSDFAQVPGEALVSSSPKSPLPPPPPLTPAPPVTMEEATATSPPKLTTSPVALNTAPVPITEMETQEIPEQQPSPTVNPAPVGIQPILSPVPPAPITPEMKIMTRKRSSMSAATVAAKTTTLSQDPVPNAVAVPEAAQPLEVQSAASTFVEPQPPKKKKKYTPKPKKKAPAPTAPATGTVDGTTAGTSNPSEANTTPEALDNEADKPVKPRKPSQPRKKPAVTFGSFKPKKGKQAPATANAAGTEIPEETSEGPKDPTAQPLVPPLKLQMPKLMKMPGAGNTKSGKSKSKAIELKIKKEPEDEDENADTEINEDGSDESGNGKGSSRKKKSKGRNGNIYIGVFNRIEWMKLQNEFGFGSVNNFGTFVLQTMRRVHGDIQFWCDVAQASGVYPELDLYEWRNGFPHAVNKEGKTFVPEPEVKMSDEKREEVIEMAKGMWDKRLQELKKLQPQPTGEEEAANLEIIAEDEEEDDEDEEDAGLENYLENMASGKYSPGTLGGEGGDDAAAAMGNDVDRIWNEQMNDADSLEKFGKLFSYINSIATMGKSPVPVGVTNQGQDVVEEKIGEEIPTGGEGDTTEAIIVKEEDAENVKAI